MLKQIIGETIDIPLDAGDVITAFAYRDRIHIVCQRQVLVFADDRG